MPRRRRKAKGKPKPKPAPPPQTESSMACPGECGRARAVNYAWPNNTRWPILKTCGAEVCIRAYTRVKVAARVRAFRHRGIALGLCTSCGRRPPRKVRAGADGRQKTLCRFCFRDRCLKTVRQRGREAAAAVAMQDAFALAELRIEGARQRLRTPVMPVQPPRRRPDVPSTAPLVEA